MEEKKGDKPVYGLVVDRVNDWNPIWTQVVFSIFYSNIQF